ncbi:hypothetical protein BDQ12DRAFT_604534 [Crucibulum laeve]|uniref:DUF3533 domain-containing protein n=1 Tax=Crucibulum laeve TaxID=68775 RepID=A0A5C3M1P6_9AGAR|nr:hypothetical protein BDQ12DRAFT_604534 [Crucibulum laeve]
MHKTDQHTKTARAVYLKAYIGGMFMVTIVIFAIFSIYWGSLWKVPAGKLEGWIVDFDEGRIGENVTHELLSMPNHVISWTQVPASLFSNGRDDILHAVRDEQVWVVASINSGASLRLNSSVSNPNSSYNGSDAITVYAIEARNENAFRSFIRPTVQGQLDTIKQSLAATLAEELALLPNLSSLMSTSPQTVVAPILYTIDNFIPFDQPVASAATFVGLIYLLILSFFTVMIGNGAREASGLNRLLTFRSLIALRFLSPLVGYFFLSLFYSLLNVAFHLDLGATFGRAGFMVFWMLNWCGMLAVGLALEALLPLLTVRFIPFFLIAWIISNVSVCIFPIDMLPTVYRYGYGAPFYNVSRSIRTIAFGTKNNVGMNFGILLAWVAVSCISMPLIQWFVRRPHVRKAEDKYRHDSENGSDDYEKQDGRARVDG